LSWFKRLKDKDKEGFVLSVLGEYGESSKEFYFVVQDFVFYIMMKHGLFWDEDTFQEAFLSVFEKIKYWDKEKGNLLSFMYSLIRDKVSQKKYWLSAEGFRNSTVDDEYGEGEELSSDLWLRYDNGNEAFWDLLIREASSDVVRGLRKEVQDSILEGVDSVYRRAVLWHMMGS
jgi:DNA-directed RNA polymerase specialized sigma24 family protein